METSGNAAETELPTPSITIGPWQDPIALSVPPGVQLDTTSLSLSSFGNDIFLFGKQEGGINIYWAQSSGSTFSGIELLEFAGTPPLTQGPVTAAASSTQLTLVWSGEPNDDTMWMNTYNGSPASWIGNQVQISIPPGYSICPGTGPALSYLNGVAYLLCAGGGLNGYFYTSSSLPSSNNWPTATRVENTGPQNTFATPKLVLSSGSLLSLWAAPSGNQVVYGTITPTSASTLGVVSAPAAPIFAAASVQMFGATVAVLLWNTGGYQINVLGKWLPIQAASSNFQLPSDIPGFAAVCLDNTLYVAWANGSNVMIQTAPVTI